jgi:hypothetical protein
MFTRLFDGALHAVLSLIKIALAVVLLFAFIAWARANPDVAQRMLSQVGNAAASVVTWVSGLVVDWTS